MAEEQINLESLRSLTDDLARIIHTTISAIPSDVDDQEYTDTLRQLSNTIIDHIVSVDPVRVGSSVQMPANVEHARAMASVAIEYLKSYDSEYKS